MPVVLAVAARYSEWGETGGPLQQTVPQILELEEEAGMEPMVMAEQVVQEYV